MNRNTTTSGSARRSAGNVFCQLRQLAVQVESGIGSLQTALDSKRVRDGGDGENTKAVNILLHTKKDIADLKDEVTTHLAEFSQENAKIDRVSELMNHVLALQSQRLERVESHFQNYGYKQPVLKTMAKNPVSAANDGSSVSFDVNSVADDQSGDSDNKVLCELTNNMKGADLKTPPRQAAGDKPADYNVMRTPKLEDIYSHLSEETLAFIKHGVRSTLHNEVPPTQNTTLKAYSNSNSLMKTPEPPVLRSGMFTLNDNKSKVSALKSNTSTPPTPRLHTPGMSLSRVSGREVSGAGVSNKTMTDMSFCQVKVPVRTPEMPTLLMPRFHLNSTVNAVQTETGKSAKSCFDTPPTPELKTYAFRRKGSAHCFNDLNEKNAHTSHTAGLSTPEAPKLFSVASLSTPEVPKLFSATGLSTPEVPKLLTHDHHFSHYLEKKWDA